MSRLFWKLFFSFWLTLLVAAAAVAIVLELYRAANEPPEGSALLASGGHINSTVKIGATVLETGGLPVLIATLKELQESTPIPLFAVDEDGVDLLHRDVSAGAIAEADRLASSDDSCPTAKRVLLDDGRSLLLFIPAEAVKPPPLFENDKPPSGFKPESSRPPPPEFKEHRPPPPSPWIPGVAGLLASILFSALLAWYLVAPVRHLRSAFQAASRGDLETRVQPLIGHRRDEIADLGRAYDSMADQVSELISIQQRLFHDVSHELRSPLARLHVAIGLARQKPEMTTTMLERIEQEVERLDLLVGETLVLARLESGLSVGNESLFDLVELAEDIIADARFEAEVKNCRIDYEGVDKVMFFGQPELIARAFENVIRNAVKYSPYDSTIKVQSFFNPDTSCFTLDVIDSGIGVPGADLDTIFEPFYRASGASSREGYGLGLAIARRAIETYGGSIKAVNAVKAGLRVTITIKVGADH